MSDSIQQMRVVVAKGVLVTVFAVVLLMGVAYGIAKGVGKPQLAVDIATSSALLLLAGVPGLLLAVVLTGKVRGGASIGFIAGIATRLPAGGVLALYGLNWGLAQTQSFSQVVAAAYLGILVIEVVCMSPVVKRTAAAEAGTPPTTQAGQEESV